jgi:predicted metal-dependent hydrolase
MLGFVSSTIWSSSGVMKEMYAFFDCLRNRSGNLKCCNINKSLSRYESSFARAKTTLKKREELMNAFYRSELKKQIPSLIEKYEKITGISVKEFRIKKMKTKWGACNPKKKRVWINLELAKKPLRSLEYVIVHEMTHLVERNHTDAFRMYMDSFMKQWVQHKEELNSTALGYSEWKLI